MTAFPIQAGDILRISTQGGGGYGDPLERDPFRVHKDVTDGKVSPEQGDRAYGVVLDSSTSKVDEGATRERRSELAAQRIYLAPQRADEPVFDGGMRVGWVNPAQAERSVVEGDMAEFFTSHLPAPLRVRVKFHADLPADGLLLGSEVWSTLELTDGEKLLWRPLGADVTPA